jgi:hypothetical protein
MAEHEAEILDRLGRIERTLTGMMREVKTIAKNQENIMSGLTDLQNAETAQGVTISDLLTEVAAFIADVQTALGNADSDAAVEAAAQLLEQQNAQVQQAITTLQAADPVNPAPAPAAS